VGNDSQIMSSYFCNDLCVKTRLLQESLISSEERLQPNPPKGVPMRRHSLVEKGGGMVDQLVRIGAERPTRIIGYMHVTEERTLR
jgi:hypothetical protein